MKGFFRENTLFSLCGLNCGLCPMRLDKRCPGCGGGEGNQSCSIARCCVEREKVQYCFQCANYPCARYDGIDDYDSFITHQNQKSDIQKAIEIGIDAYNAEQEEKAKTLKYLLENYNDGRRKTFFCVSVNLLELTEIRAVIEQFENGDIADMSAKEKSAAIVKEIRSIAMQKGIEPKLRKKPKSEAK